MQPAGQRPIIITLAIDASAQAAFDTLRQAHFPPERNWLAAHVTLFHKVPGEHRETVERHCSEVAKGRSSFEIDALGPMLLGHGVAIALGSAELAAVRGLLAKRFARWLTPQDRQPFRPHVTIQNKVEPETARALFDDFSSNFEPFRLNALGLRLWHYEGGPWSPLSTVFFQPKVL